MSDGRSKHSVTNHSDGQTNAMGTDAILLDRLRAGQGAAFESLFRQHYARIYRVLYRLVGDEADDLAQEVFLQLYRRPPAAAETDLGAWLHRVAVNLGYNALRASQRRRGYRAILARLPGGDWQPVEAGPEEWTEAQEEQQRVRVALGRLSQREAAVLVLRYDDMSYREIALVLGVAPGSVGTLLARAERAFSKVYARLGDDNREVNNDLPA